MPLILTLSGARGAADQASRTLDRGTLSIGRAAGNDWVLPDPERLLSKTHCIVTAAGGRYLLTDLSTNGVYVNGAATRVPRNGQAELTDGDELRLGDYALTVTITSAAAAGRAAAAGNTDAVLTADPLADRVEDPALDPFTAADTPGFAHPLATPPPAQLRAIDPFDEADQQRGGARRDPDDDLFHGIAPAENWTGPSQSDHADAAQHVIAVGGAVQVNNFDDLDIDALLGDEPPLPGSAPVPVPRAQPGPMGAALSGAMAPAPAPRAAPPPPRPAPPPIAQVPEVSPFAEEESAPPPRAAQVAPPPVASPPAALAPASAATAAATSAALLAAFLDGAGVPDLALAGDPAAAMRAAGTVFRILVDGLRQVLMSRAAIKNEFRVEQTMLRARDNNALKFAVTVEDAIAALLQPARPGYKPPLESAKEAFDDVRAHEMAVMAGVQTALLGLLKRFEPGALEARLQPGLLGNLLPASRKARTWELFCNTYKDIAREAEDDFQAVFGREFARAYDAQIRKL